MSLLPVLLCLLPIAHAQIILSHSGMITTRLDPIVNPGVVGGHVHTIAGGSSFASTYDPNTILDATCNDMGKQTLLDKSNYWVPTVYWQWTDGTFSKVPSTGANTYYLNRGSGDKIEPFPVGFRMVAGDPNRRTFDANNVAHKAPSFVCLDGSPETHDLWGTKNNPCYGPNMRLQINMPQCSDGRATSDDNSHITYAMGNNPDNGKCPPSHPHHMISLFYEFFFQATPEMKANTGKYVLAQGDPTGYGMHGDFTNGWDQKLLEDMVEQCFNKDIGQNGGFTDCPPLVAAQKGPEKCESRGQKVDEDLGETTKLKALPGCNPVWDGTGTKPTCPAMAVPALIDLATGQTVMPGQAAAPGQNGTVQSPSMDGNSTQSGSASGSGANAPAGSAMPSGTSPSNSPNPTGSMSSNVNGTAPGSTEVPKVACYSKRRVRRVATVF